MKKTVILGIFIGAIGLIGPKIIGSGVNEKIDDFVGALNKTPGYEATIVSSQSSWFSTVATVKIGLDPGMFGDLSASPEAVEFFEDFSINAHVTAQHGPLLTLNGLGLGLLALKAQVDEATLRDYLAYSEDERLYSLLINIGLLGSASYTDEVQAFNVVDGSDTADSKPLSFSGWSGGGTMSASHLDYRGQMDSLTMPQDGNSALFQIQSVSLAMNVDDSWANMIAGAFYDSSFEFVIGSIIVGSPMKSGTKVRVENIVMDGVSEKSDDGELMDMAINYGIETIASEGFNAKDLVLNTEFNNLEKSFFTAFQDASVDPSEIEQMTEVLKSSLLPQLQASPEFNITEMSGSVGNGSFSGKMLMKITGVDSLPDVPEDPGFWLSKAGVDSAITVDKAMALWVAEKMLISQLQGDAQTADQMTNKETKDLAVQQAGTMIETFSQQGMVIVNDEGNYTMTFTLTDGQATLNGNPMPLPF
mgnify:CR=1 FL=1